MTKLKLTVVAAPMSTMAVNPAHVVVVVATNS